jgi:excisionase family DNA binding protein
LVIETHNGGATVIKRNLPDQSNRNVKIAYQINEAVLASGLGRTTIYDEIKQGRLKAIKVAGRRLILREDLEAFLKAAVTAA